MTRLAASTAVEMGQLLVTDLLASRLAVVDRQLSKKSPACVALPPEKRQSASRRQEVAQTDRDALFSGGEEMSIPVPWLVAQHPVSIERT
jgi:hypothetical protein